MTSRGRFARRAISANNFGSPSDLRTPEQVQKSDNLHAPDFVMPNFFTAEQHNTTKSEDPAATQQPIYHKNSADILESTALGNVYSDSSLQEPVMIDFDIHSIPQEHEPSSRNLDLYIWTCVSN